LEERKLLLTFNKNYKDMNYDLAMNYNLVKINRTWVREVNDLYNTGGMSSERWVSREEIELIVYEYENCVKD
jgi:hypothetical protein